MTDPYQVLGVDRDADDDEVKSAYREKAKEHHPDTGGDEEKFKKIKEAYEEITSENENPFGEDSPFGNGGPFGGGFSGGFGDSDKTVEDFIRDFEGFRRGGGFGGAGFSGDPFGETKTVNNIQIDFATAVYGGEVSVQTEAGRMKAEVPAGVHNGDDFQMNPRNIVRFTVYNNTGYWRNNRNDIYTERTISVWDAMIGLDIQVQTLDGRSMNLPIDPGTTSGQLYRLSGEGGPETYDGKPQGDFYVEINVNIPAVTDQETVEVINEIQEGP